MPAGMSWTRYITFTVIAMASMLAGAQCIHVIYKPLEDIDDLVEQRLREIREGEESHKAR